MADLKTTAEERATVRGAVGAWQHDDALAAMAALDDLDTLRAENAAMSEEVEWRRAEWGDHERRTADHLATARASKAECRAENARLRAVAEAARNLTNWDWMCMLDDNESPCVDDVRADVRKLKSALSALEAP